MGPQEHSEQVSHDHGALTENNGQHHVNSGVGIGASLMAGMAGVSLLFGFGFTLTMAKKRDPGMFNKGLVGSRNIPESGGSLAMRALGLGTLYAVSGVGLLCYGIWKLLGVHNMKEFTKKLQSIMPEVPKNEPQGKSDFKTIRELTEYIIKEDASKKSS